MNYLRDNALWQLLHHPLQDNSAGGPLAHRRYWLWWPTLALPAALDDSPLRAPVCGGARWVAPRALSPDSGEWLSGRGEVRIQVFLFQECRTRQGLRVGRTGSPPPGTEVPEARSLREGSGRVGALPPCGPSPTSLPLPPPPPPPRALCTAPLRGPPGSVSRAAATAPRPSPSCGAECGPGGSAARAGRAKRSAWEAAAAGTRRGAGARAEERAGGGHGLAAPGPAEGSARAAQRGETPHTIAPRAAPRPSPAFARARPPRARPPPRPAPPGGAEPYASPAAREGAGIVRPLPLPPPPQPRGAMGAARRPGPGLERSPLRR